VYWPGPLTIVVESSTGMPAEVLAPDDTIAIRLPNHMLAIELIERAGGVVACTSANISGRDPAASAQDVFATLGPALDGVVEGGIAPGGVPSTIIRIADGEILTVREGPIPIEHIRARWYSVRTELKLRNDVNSLPKPSRMLRGGLGMVSDFGEGVTSQDQTIAGERKDTRHDPATTGGTVLGSVHPPAYGRGLLVSIVAAAIVFALAIFASGGQEEYTGIPMTQTTGSLFWGLSILAIILVGVASQYAEGAAIRVAESLGQEPTRRNQLPSAWAVPAASMATALLLVATYHNKVMLIAGPAIAFLGVAGVLCARDLREDTMEGAERTAALIHTIVIHAIAFLGLSAVYMN